jgi:hypothetical protein
MSLTRTHLRPFLASEGYFRLPVLQHPNEVCSTNRGINNGRIHLGLMEQLRPLAPRRRLGLYEVQR